MGELPSLQHEIEQRIKALEAEIAGERLNVLKKHRATGERGGL